MNKTRVTDHRRGEDSVQIRLLRRHETVGGKQKGAGNIFEFFLLVLPCSTEIAFQMTVLFKLGVAVGRQHFTMGVDIDTLALSLLKKVFKIMKVMPAYDNERSFFHSGGYLGRNRVAIGRCIGFIQKGHAF